MNPKKKTDLALILFSNYQDKETCKTGKFFKIIIGHMATMLLTLALIFVLWKTNFTFAFQLNPCLGIKS